MGSTKTPSQFITAFSRNVNARREGVGRSEGGNEKMRITCNLALYSFLCRARAKTRPESQAQWFADEQDRYIGPGGLFDQCSVNVTDPLG